MITVDCSKVQSIKTKLLVYVADRLGVLPILKSDKFILTTIDDSQTVEKSSVLAAIEKFLESKNLKKDIQIISKGDDIIIAPQEGKTFDASPERKKELFFECTHCGFMTQYEIEWKTHKLIHYI